MKLHDHLTFGENETGVEINRWKPASWEFGVLQGAMEKISMDLESHLNDSKQRLLNTQKRLRKDTFQTTNMAMEHPPFEDVFPIENGDIPPLLCSL